MCYRRSRYFSILAKLVFLFSFVFILPAALAQVEEIELIIKDGRFNPQEIKVKANRKTKLIVTNSERSAAEFESIDLDREKIILPGRRATILLPKLEPGIYEFFDHFHPKIPKGRIIVE